MDEKTELERQEETWLRYWREAKASGDKELLDDLARHAPGMDQPTPAKWAGWYD